MTVVQKPLNLHALCLETHAAHGGSEGWSSGGCEGMFVTESSAFARGRDCLAANVVREAPRRQITTAPRPPVLNEVLAFCHQPRLPSEHFRSVAYPAAWIRIPS